MGGWGQVTSLHIEEMEVRGLNRTLEPARGDPASSSKTRTQAFCFWGVVFFIRVPHPLAPPELLPFKEPWTSTETPLEPVRDGMCVSPKIHVLTCFLERDRLKMK